jgi:CAAX protease family protein
VENDKPRAVAKFVVVVTATSVAFWILGFVQTGRLLLPGLPTSALMFVAPLFGVVAALGPKASVRAIASNLPAGRDAVRRVARSLWWAPVMPAVVFATYPLQAWAGRDLPVFTVDWPTAALLLLAFLVSGAIEELGWTWFLTARLLRRWRPVWVGLGLGALWAALHSVPYAQAGNSAAWVAGQCLFTVVLRLVLVLAYDMSGGSLSTVVVLHATYNVAWGLFPTMGSHYSPAYTAALTAGVAMALAAVRLLAPGRIVTPPPIEGRS